MVYVVKDIIATFRKIKTILILIRFKRYFSHPEKSKLKSSNVNPGPDIYILKTIKNATGTSVVFPVNVSFIHYVLVLTSVPNVGECFTKT